jgi:hypothetical protein
LWRVMGQLVKICKAPYCLDYSAFYYAKTHNPCKSKSSDSHHM